MSPWDNLALNNLKHIFVFVIVALGTFFLLSQMSSMEDSRRHAATLAEIETLGEEANQALLTIPVVPPAPQPIAGDAEVSIPGWEDARYISEVFTTTKMIPFEVTDDSLIGQIRGALLYESAIFVTDYSQARILMFDENGRFIKVVAPQGQGPGEVQSTNSMRKVFDNHFAVSDGYQGLIHVFDKSGSFRFSTPRPFKATNFLSPNWAFHWPSKEHLFLAGVKAINDAVPNHVKAKVRYDDRGSPVELIPEWGFGQRNSYYKKRSGASFAFNSFHIVGENIWAGSTKLHEIHIYDLKGRWLRAIKPKCENPMTEDVWKEIPGHGREYSMNYQKTSRDYCNTNSFYVFDEVVLVNHHKGYLPFDHQGRQLSTRHLKANLGFNGTYNGMGVVAISIETFPPGTKLSPNLMEDRRILREMGFPVDNPDEENPLIKLVTLNR